MPKVQTLGADGVKIDLLLSSVTDGPWGYAWQMENLTTLAPYIAAVEGPNEINYQPIAFAGLSGTEAAKALQSALYARVHGHPSLQGIPVYNLTLAGAATAEYAALGDLSSVADYTNAHIYPTNGAPPLSILGWGLQNAAQSTPGKPKVVTETGYYTLPEATDWGGVTEDVQAEYVLELLLDAYSAGVERTFLYELLDQGPNAKGPAREQHFGLFHEDGSPKPAATALRNMLSLLADSNGAPATPGALRYGIKDAAATVHDLLLQKSDGAYWIALWDETNLWDSATRQAVERPAPPVMLDLDRPATVTVYDPMDGTTPIAGGADVTHAAIVRPDRPLLLEVRPSFVSDPDAAAPPPGAAATIGSGPDALVLKVQQDAYRGDAHYVVRVDGVQIGGVLTASATRASGGFDTVTVRGDFAPGRHTATVGFLDDAWGGTAATDRNLYVAGATYNGAALPGVELALYKSGPMSFGFTDVTG